jgi:hypothetical protein
VAAGDQVLDHGDHLRDEGRRPRLLRGRQGAQRAHVVVVPADRLLGALADQLLQAAGVARLLPGERRGVDLVVHVREVADIGDVILAVDVAEQAEQDVEDHDGPRVAEVRAVVDGGAADIHPHVRGSSGRSSSLRRVRVLVRRIVVMAPRTGGCPRALSISLEGVTMRPA